MIQGVAESKSEAANIGLSNTDLKEMIEAQMDRTTEKIDAKQNGFQPRSWIIGFHSVQ